MKLQFSLTSSHGTSLSHYPQIEQRPGTTDEIYVGQLGGILEIAAGLSLISAGSRRSRVPADNFKGRRTCGMCHVLSHGSFNPCSCKGGEKQKEDDGVNGSPLSLFFFFFSSLFIIRRRSAPHCGEAWSLLIALGLHDLAWTSPNFYVACLNSFREYRFRGILVSTRILSGIFHILY